VNSSNVFSFTQIITAFKVLKLCEKLTVIEIDAKRLIKQSLSPENFHAINIFGNGVAIVWSEIGLHTALASLYTKAA